VTPKLKDKLLVPVLGDQYGNVLIKGDLVPELDERHGEVGVRYFEHWFRRPGDYPCVSIPAATSCQPVAPRNAWRRSSSRASCARCRRCRRITDRRGRAPGAARRDGRGEEAPAQLAERPGRRRALARSVAALNGVAGERASYERLHELLERQAYRLAYWRVAADEINYRRFDINDLRAAHAEHDVLEAHRKLLEGFTRVDPRLADRPSRRSLRSARLPRAAARALA
jgi:(1->4)-alpha-D-glucan 1-alpha-D-glucosylmutase